MKLRIARVGAVLFLALAGDGAVACGHCVEDRIAAVYDHALQQRMVAGKYQMAFFALHGEIANDEASRRRVLALTEATPGSIKGSARVSIEPAAIAIAFDPRQGSLKAIEGALQQSLRPLRLSIVPLPAPAVR